jgi:predicted nucleic acid-binding Zn ribbon protein
MPRGTTTCLICNAALSYLQQVQGERFCGERCRGKHTTLRPHQVCLVCGRPLSPRELGVGVCASLECRHEVEEQKRERERRRLEALEERAGELRDREAKALGLQEPETYRPTVIPSFRARITNLAERRRRAFRDGVNRLISKASASLAASSPSEAGPLAPPASSVAPAPEVQAVLNGACALCQGFCCGRGGDHAYLTVETIRRYMVQHPGQRPRDVLAAYLDRMGSKTFEGSCLFHVPGGCGLPRDMRSDTCNRFFCEGLKGFQQGLTGQDPARGFFVSTSGDAIRAAAFCDEDGPRVVRLPPVPDQEEP